MVARKKLLDIILPITLFLAEVSILSFTRLNPEVDHF